jgi:hypothetical protein
MRCVSVLTVRVLVRRARQRSQWRDERFVRPRTGAPSARMIPRIIGGVVSEAALSYSEHQPNLQEGILMKKKLIVVGAMLTLLLLAAPVAASHLFPDVPTGSPGSWARERHDAVDLLVNDGIVTGYNDGTFKGDNAANRNQFALWMARAYDAWIACPEGMSREVVDVYVERPDETGTAYETGWQLIEVCTDEGSFAPAENGQPLPVEAIGGR